MTTLQRLKEIRRHLETLSRLLVGQSQDIQEEMAALRRVLDQLEAEQYQALALERARPIIEAVRALRAETPGVAPDLRPGAEIVLGAIIEALGAERGFIVLRDPSGDFKVNASANYPQEVTEEVPDIVIKEVVNTGHSMLTSNAQIDNHYGSQNSIVMRGLRSITAVPIKDGGEVVGVVYADTRFRSGLFKTDDMLLVETITAQLSDLLLSPNMDKPLPPPQPAQPPAAVSPSPAPPRRQEAPANQAESSPEIPEPQSVNRGAGINVLDWLAEQAKRLAGSDEKAEAAGEGAPPEPATVPPAPPGVSGSVIYDLDDVLTEEDESELATEILHTPANAVQFSAYYPVEIIPGSWEPLFVYMFRAYAVQLVEKDARGEVAARGGEFRRASSTARQFVEDGAILTVTPHLPGFQFNPPHLPFGFYEDWQRLDFKMRAHTAPLEIATNGGVTFALNGVIIAEVPLSVFVTRSPRPTRIVSENRIYNAIFCSYSHDDTRVVERVERAYKALGLDYLRDIHSLKSGQTWNDKLYEMIDRADIFQLFWSPTAARSQYVELEWRHALTRSDRPAFIRPVYWTKPIPSVPQALSHIHFAYEPELAED